MQCISINYKTSPIEIREKVAFNEENKIKYYSDNRITEKSSGCVILSTCNRTEIYFVSKYDSAFAEEVLADIFNIDISYLRNYLRVYDNAKAVYHLFRVTSGMESMVFGEDEILRQIKEAYYYSLENKHTCYELNRIFQYAIHCAKEIKSKTSISHLPVSFGTLTANICTDFAKTLKKIPNVLIIGISGKIGSVIAKNLLSINKFNIFATIRTHKIENENSFEKVEFVEFSERYKLIDSYDIIISATTSPHYTITADNVKSYIHSDKKRIFIDLAIPRDIDGKVCELPNTKLYDIDYFRECSKQNDKLRLCESKAMENIIFEQLSDLKKDILFHDFLLDKSSVKENSELTDILYKMKTVLSADEFGVILNLLQAVV